MKAKDIARNVHGKFFKNPEEAKRIRDGIERILTDFFERQDFDKTTKDVIDFLRKIWGHFSIGRYANIFVDFAKAEKALYGFGEHYRDHLMHVFNVHLIGLLTFSEMLKKYEDRIFELLKVREEPDKVPFPSRYTKYRRLYYLWCLISTFHDIAIPIDRRRQVIRGLGRYMDYFRIETEDLDLKFPFMTQLDISRYSDLMSKLFASGILLSESRDKPTYEVKSPNASLYLYFQSVLSGAMNQYNHAVLGAYFLFRSIEEMFLSGKNPNPQYDLDLHGIVHNGKTVELPQNKKEWNGFIQKTGISKEEVEKCRVYDLSKGETEAYNDYIFEQDVTRAAIAIALHNVDPNKNPKIFPIKFSKFPLSFFLILFDEIQEFYRPEGLVLTEVVRWHEFPRIDVNIKSSHERGLRIQVTLNFDLEKPEEEVTKELIKKFNGWQKKEENKVRNYSELVRATWNHIFKTLDKKLAFEIGEPLEIRIKVTVEGEQPNGRLLQYERNWTSSLHEEASQWLFTP